MSRMPSLSRRRAWEMEAVAIVTVTTVIVVKETYHPRPLVSSDWQEAGEEGSCLSEQLLCLLYSSSSQVQDIIVLTFKMIH